MTLSLFGTDGVRNAVGRIPFTHEQLPQFGNALALWLRHTYGDHARVLIGYDTRISCSWIAASLKSGLLQHPLALYNGYVLPTPAVCYLVQHSNQFDAGIIISASHNPYHDNGIKLIKKTGKLTQEDERHIELLLQEPLIANYQNFGTEYCASNAAEQYTAILKSFFPVPFLRNKKIVVDCAHGAFSAIAQTVFEHCGATAIMLNNTPTGTNINDACGATAPESLARAVLANTADAGIAFDGDGDRVVLVNANGEIKDGDDIVALLAYHPDYHHESTIVGTIMSNVGLEHFVQSQQKNFVRTAVGDKHIGAYLKQHNLLLGGEPSGHIITRDYLETGDGLFAGLKALAVVAATNNWSMNIFTHMPHITINLPVSCKRDLNEPELANIIAAHTAQLVSGRLIIRYSGTEPLLRIMIEDQTQHHAQEVGARLARELQKAL